MFISLDVDVRPFLACMTSAPGAALQRTTKVLLRRPYLHAPGASLHQPKYSFKTVQIFMSHSLFTSWAAMSILSFVAWMWQRQTSRRPSRAPNQQPKYSSNGPIFMQLASRSTNQSTHLNGAIFMSHSIFVSWAAMSILSFLAWMWQDKQVGALTALQTSNQRTPQTALSSCSWRLTPPTKVLYSIFM